MLSFVRTVNRVLQSHLQDQGVAIFALLISHWFQFLFLLPLFSPEHYRICEAVAVVEWRKCVHFQVQKFTKPFLKTFSDCDSLVIAANAGNIAYMLSKVFQVKLTAQQTVFPLRSTVKNLLYVL